MRGRAFQQKPILGAVDELQSILQSLEASGAAVDRIVVATAKDRFWPRAPETLLEVEKSSNIIVQSGLAFRILPKRRRSYQRCRNHDRKYDSCHESGRQPSK
jgi:hypothetical protein